jgi:2-pyrone-4,6-dicarboxylate lactonase
MSTPTTTCQGPDRHTRRPKFQVPVNSVDCHAHVFGPQAIYPFSPDRSYTPEDCTADQYLAMLDTIGVTRAVLVQGGPHGTDNTATLAAIKQAGNRFRGVAVIPSGLPEQERADLHRQGIRGVRMSTVVRGGVGFDHLENLSAECEEFGWHVLLHLHKSHELVDLIPRLKKTSAPFMLDHLGRVRADEGIGSPGFKAVMELLDTDRCWIKLASLYRLSSEAYPHSDMLPLIHKVVEARPDRIVWGSNWPHPIHAGPMPNDGDLVDLIPLWVPDARHREQMLVTNPAKLYGFE